MTVIACTYLDETSSFVDDDSVFSLPWKIIHACVVYFDFLIKITKMADIIS